MSRILKPKSEAELAALVANAKAPFAVRGTGSKDGWGRPVAAEQVLDLSGFSAIHAYEPEELILEAGAGTTRATLAKLLDKKNQHFAFEPPDFSALFGSKHAGTLGGMLACNLAGPRRIQAGAARDHVLGVAGVSGRGEVFKAGASVVKNVTGYDVPKLMAHSFGTLAAMTSVIFKVLPKPETQETLLVQGLDDEAAVQVMSLAMQSSNEVSGAAHVPGRGTYLRLEGIAASVSYRREKLLKLVGGKAEVLGERDSRAAWTQVRDVADILSNTKAHVWRVSLTPSQAPSYLAALNAVIDSNYFMDWAGGLVWLAVDGDQSQHIRSLLPSGHATLLRAPDEVRARVDVFQPQPASLAALSQRIKVAFDPDRKLNPGRMYQDV